MPSGITRLFFRPGRKQCTCKHPASPSPFHWYYPSKPDYTFPHSFRPGREMFFFVAGAFSTPLVGFRLPGSDAGAYSELRTY